jgi:NDP-sugar pyrophosphorylase family protein
MARSLRCSRGGPSDFGHDVFPQAVEQNLAVFAWRLSSPVIDICTPEGLTLGRSASKTRVSWLEGDARAL